MECISSNKFVCTESVTIDIGVFIKLSIGKQSVSIQELVNIIVRNSVYSAYSLSNRVNHKVIEVVKTVSLNSSAEYIKEISPHSSVIHIFNAIVFCITLFKTVKKHRRLI